MNAQYRFDDVLPSFPGLYAHGLFEYVNNGRTPALTLGVQNNGIHSAMWVWVAALAGLAP